MKPLLAIAGVLALAAPAAEAYSQVVGTYRVRAGLGAQVRPEFLGADSTEIVPYPSFSIAKGDEPFGFGAPDDSFDIGLLGNDKFSAGPVLALSNGRDEDEIVEAAVRLGPKVSAEDEEPPGPERVRDILSLLHRRGLVSKDLFR